jgi:hypothetical protein
MIYSRVRSYFFIIIYIPVCIESKKQAKTGISFRDILSQEASAIGSKAKPKEDTG